MKVNMQDMQDLSLPVIGDEEVALERLVLVAKALSDPIRMRMLGLMALGRHCCDLPSSPLQSVPATAETEGICVCEFEGRYNLAQSKVSYHLRVLKEAGLVREEVRGKWTFYSLNRQAARETVALIQQQLGLDPVVDPGDL